MGTGEAVIPQNLEALTLEVERRVQDIRDGLPAGIDASTFTIESKLPFKAVTYREVLLHRLVDVAASASEAVRAGRPVSAATLTRSIMEAMARMHELRVRLDGWFKEPDPDKLDEFLMNRMFGARHNHGTLPTAANILGAVDKTDEHIPYFRHNYDRLSELAHPNYLGGMGVFAQVDRQTHYVSFEGKHRSDQELIVTANILIGTLEGFVVLYNHVGGTIEILDRYLAGKAQA